MTTRLQYGTPAKIFHWLIVTLLAAQYPIGWLMPDLHRGMSPGAGMTFHVSIGITILVLTALRLLWRMTHPVAPESSLPAWQRVSSEAVHWLLYALVLATTVSGWLFASFRGWSVSFFYLARYRCLRPTMLPPAGPLTAFTRRWNGRCSSPFSFISSPRSCTSSSIATA